MHSISFNITIPNAFTTEYFSLTFIHFDLFICALSLIPLWMDLSLFQRIIAINSILLIIVTINQIFLWFTFLRNGKKTLYMLSVCVCAFGFHLFYFFIWHGKWKTETQISLCTSSRLLSHSQSWIKICRNKNEKKNPIKNPNT